jgi:hypothetical protein
VEAAPDERTLRRARKVIWVFRLIFYPGAAILAAAILAGRSEAGPSLLEGTTDQNRGVTLTLNGDLADRVTLTVLTRCPDGHEYPSLVQTRTLTMHGNTFEGRKAWDQEWTDGSVGTATLRVRGRLEGDTARGTATLVHQLGDYVCEAETAFSAG